MKLYINMGELQNLAKRGATPSGPAYGYKEVPNQPI